MEVESMTPATTVRKVFQLQVNVGTGAWRTVMDFRVRKVYMVMDRAEKLFLCGHTNSTKGIRLRIMKPGDTRPLMHWSENEGWQAWEVRA
jgi:hypothetical protein